MTNTFTCAVASILVIIGFAIAPTAHSQKPGRMSDQDSLDRDGG